MRIPVTTQEFIEWPSLAESKRFNRRVRRYVLVGPSAEPMLQAIRKQAAELSVVRIPTDRLDVLAGLHREFDPVILADCLVIYHLDDLQDRPADGGPSRDGVAFLEATRADAARLDSIVGEAFRGYRNHYSANPAISQNDVLEGYKEWAGQFIESPNRKVVLAYVAGEEAGFATLEFFSDEGHVVLNGVRPTFRGQGVYRAIVRMAVKEFMMAGLPRVVISTQVDNRPVQRVWVTEGFQLANSYYTVHVVQG